jgi:hypothetical protein
VVELRHARPVTTADRAHRRHLRPARPAQEGPPLGQNRNGSKKNRRDPRDGLPVCNPLAIPIFGAAGILSFLAPYRGLIALLSIVLLAVTLLVRLRTTRTCQLAPQAGPSPGSPR